MTSPKLILNNYVISLSFFFKNPLLYGNSSGNKSSNFIDINSQLIDTGIIDCLSDNHINRLNQFLPVCKAFSAGIDPYY